MQPIAMGARVTSAQVDQALNEPQVPVAVPQRPSPEELEKVRPWIVETIRAWDGGEYESHVNAILELIFGSSDLVVREPSREELEQVRPWIIDTVIHWARESDICDVRHVNEALAQIFSEPAGGFRDSNGVTCGGYRPDGFDAEGYDENDYSRDGFDRSGFDADGYGRDGFHRYRKTNRQGLTREEWFRTTPAGAAAFVKELGPEFIAVLRDALNAPVNTDAPSE